MLAWLAMQKTQRNRRRLGLPETKTVKTRKAGNVFLNIKLTLMGYRFVLFIYYNSLILCVHWELAVKWSHLVWYLITWQGLAIFCLNKLEFLSNSLHFGLNPADKLQWWDEMLQGCAAALPGWESTLRNKTRLTRWHQVALTVPWH